jgi:hypothetical protein
MKLPVSVDESAVDIPTMREMSIGDYQVYVESELFFVDHHDVLRSGLGQYPLAVTRAQLRVLIEYLKSIESRVGGDA